MGLSNESVPNNMEGPRFLVITRIVPETIISDTNKSLSNVSSFLIQKVVDSTCSGKVDICKKLRNGTILIKTKNSTQAKKLLNLSSLSPDILVQVSEHSSLNFCKGIIYSNDLRGMSNEEIADNLINQKVTKVDKILKKVEGSLKETGLLILTFAALELPSHIFIGYERVIVRQFIPRPLRCTRCFVYGHSSKFCNADKVCATCANPFHLDDDSSSVCTETRACVNCKIHNPENSDHPAYDRTCPIFLKEKEVQKIITLEKMSRKQALIVHKERNPSTSYAKISAANTQSTSTSTYQQINQSNSINKSLTRQIVDYSDCLSDKNITRTPKQCISILPRGVSKRTRNQMKKLTGRKKILGAVLSKTVEPDSDFMQE